MAEEKEPLEKQAEGVASSFVGALGLLDLIIGGLTLYLFRLWYDSLGTLPSTTYTVVDVALLAAGAALVGKVVALLVATFMAVFGLLLRLTPAYRRFLAALAHHEDVTGRSPATDVNKTTYALALLTTNSADRRTLFESLRSAAILCYAAALLAVPYANALKHHAAPPAAITGLRIAAFIFLVLGVLQQLNYLQTMTAHLRAVREEENHADRPLARCNKGEGQPPGHDPPPEQPGTHA